ncbi:MAG: sigma-54-dependent Fis family transcriptional regulator [Deltaproteobacteria bacterium]|nr:sigma-54-dependent Fis family transcriptional regulator [Deltaproteobacteria bacterium]MBW2620564.1 sigma-54-dependent Fis family transcriptional regulator [Deltaproteobacteria bacterium]MBW2642468.1 sigma-54-dependent Fis family transcriptional regulator [Deltaproteobacteria bacterium]
MATDDPLILIVDDEPAICRNCIKILSKMDYGVKYAFSGYDALKMIGENQFDVVITDLKMANLGGMEVLRQLKKAHPETMVIVITGYASVSSAVEVMKMGAFDYLPKPFTPHELRAVVHQALVEREMLLQNQRLRYKIKHQKSFSHQLIGDSPKIKKVITMVQKVAPTDSTVLVYGESGTGKELISRAIHANSARKDKVFFAVDCGTLSDKLLESELFGYNKGAFTGAHKNKDGIFKLAHNGTVFLDEISNIDLNVQSKLLRFIENREFLPLGSTAIQKVDVRLIFATNQDLKKMVDQGSFREDFYYRIFVYPIMVPPLRKRKMDILPIAYHFLRQFNQALGKNISGFDDNIISKLTEHDWPGNIRQLRNVIERAVILCEKDQITFQELPLLGEMDDTGQLIDYIPSTNEDFKRVKKEIRHKAVLKVEKNFIMNALTKNDWNVTRAAQKVGLQRSNFQALMKKHNIKLPRYGQSNP